MDDNERYLENCLSFECETNCDTPYINCARFATKYGEVEIDRDTTEYSYYEDEGRMTMDWVGLYIWGEEGANYNIPWDIFDGAVLLGLYIEDDAPEDYRFSCSKCESGLNNIAIQRTEG